MHLLVLFLLSLLLMVVAAVVGTLGGGLTTPGGGTPWGPWMAWQALSQVLMFAVPALALPRMYSWGERQWLKLDFSGRCWLLALAGIVVMLLLFPLTDWLTVWNDGWHLPESLAPVENSLRQAGERSQGLLEQMMREVNPWVSLLCVALVPAVCEELFFRAGVQNLLQRWFGNVHAAVWVTAAVFSLAHFELFAFLPRFLLGALLGYLYVGGNSLVVNACVHFVNNAIVVMAFRLSSSQGGGFDPSEPLAIGWEITLACSVAAVMLFVVTFGKRLKINV